jgi:hypothetical protein
MPKGSCADSARPFNLLITQEISSRGTFDSSRAPFLFPTEVMFFTNQQ